MCNLRRIKFNCGGPYSTGVPAFRSTLAALVVISLLFVLSAGAARAQEAGHVAPLNARFLEYMGQKQAAELTGAPLVTIPPGGRPTGHIPSTIDFSYLRASAVPRATGKVASYPASFDLRSVNKVSPVRDQGDCGSCWSFGALASVESVLMPTVTSFSEQFIIDTHGFDPGPCDGGNELMAIANMAGHGIFAENLYPYQYWWPTEYMPATSSAWAGAYISSVQLIVAGLDSNGNPITTNIKNALYSEQNAVTVGFMVDQGSPYLVETNGQWCYYNNTNTMGDGHVVAIIGWDDNFPASNFGIQPPGKGAYLVKNSWGTFWGNSGYFWMSYYDKSLGTEAWVFNGVLPASTYSWTYQHDPLGWVYNYGWGSGRPTAWMANVFKGSPNGKVIRAVSFYTVDPGTQYSVEIYDSCPTSYSPSGAVVNPVGGKLLYSSSGAFASAGYNTHHLSTPVTVSLGTSPDVNFSVVVKLTDTHGYGWPIPIQGQVSGYTDRSYAPYGQSYVSLTGAVGAWYDLANAKQGFKACLKAFGTPN